MIKDVLNNYFPFYEMVKLSLLLSNRKDGKPDEDIKRIVKFIGDAYLLDDTLIDFCKEQIINELVVIGTTEDVSAFKSLSSSNPEALGKHPELLQIKCDALNDIIDETTKYDAKVNKNWFDYSYFRQYDPQMRFSQMKMSSTVGYVSANKLVAIMLALGIGCKQDLYEAILRFKQCMMWGDIASIKYVAHAYCLDGDNDNSRIYRELGGLDSYFLKGVTVLPEEDDHSKVVKELYAEISSIKHDVIQQLNLKDINYSFVEVMLSPSVSHLKKLEYINKYQYYEWKEATNSSKSSTKLGFNVGGNKDE